MLVGGLAVSACSVGIWFSVFTSRCHRPAHENGAIESGSKVAVPVVRGGWFRGFGSVASVWDVTGVR